jgi:hypothetical protein
MRRRPRNIGGQNISPIVYFTITSNTTVAFGVPPSITVVLPYNASSLAPYSYVAYYDPTANPQPGWVTIEPLNFANGNLLDFEGSGRTVYTSGVTYYFVVFTVTSALPTPTPAPTSSPTPNATPTPTPTPTPQTNPVLASVPSLSFTAVGAAYAQQFTVSQQGYSGPFTPSGINSAIASAQISGNVVTVTPLAAGSTTLTIIGAGGASVSIPISVTTLIVPVQ